MSSHPTYIHPHPSSPPLSSSDEINSIQLEALQTLISSIGNHQLPTHQTLPLAQRILSSSIVQTSTSGLTSNVNIGNNNNNNNQYNKSLSSSVLKKIQRHYSKNKNHPRENNDINVNNELQRILSNVQSIYQQYINSTSTKNSNEGEIKVVNDVIKILSRLAGTSTTMSTTITTSSNSSTHCSSPDFGHVQKNSRNKSENESSNYNPPTVLGKQSKQNHTHQYHPQYPHKTQKHLELALYDEEQIILRECIHALQYVNGNLIRFHSLSSSSSSSTSNNRWDSTTVEDELLQQSTSHTTTKIKPNQKSIQIRPNLLPFHIPSHAIQSSTRTLRLLSSPKASQDAIHLCCECGWLYSRIVSYIDYVRGMSGSQSSIGGGDNGGSGGDDGVGVGVVSRALASTLEYELQNYLLFLSSLEQQLLDNDYSSIYSSNNNDKTDITSDKTNKDQESSISPSSSSSSKRLTIRQLLISLRHQPNNQQNQNQRNNHYQNHLSKLRTMALLIDGIDPTLNGGQLLSALYLHSIHGDSKHVDLVNRILYSTSIPWYDLLYDWSMNGVLVSSPSSNNEFFIVRNDNDENYNNDDVWHGQFRLNTNQIPYLPSIGSGKYNSGGSSSGSGTSSSSLLMNESLANEILIVGKGINFIRQSLHDTKWTLDVQKLLPPRVLDDLIEKKQLDSNELFMEIKKLLGFHYDCTKHSPSSCYQHKHHHHLNKKDLSGQYSGEIITQSPLERTIRGAAQQVHKHILLSLFEEYHLLDHLQGLKEILFLGQGDFICALMDGLHAEFESMRKDGDDGVDRIYMHNMMGILHDALRSTNAKFLPEFVARCVHVKLLHLSSSMSASNHDKNNKTTCERFWIDEDEKISEKLDGWDIFSLGYHIEAPLTAVVHHEAMKKYEKVFNLLFRLKRIEWMLNSTWRQSTVLNHAIQHMTSKYGDAALGGSSSISSVRRDRDISRMKRLLRTFSMTRQVMLHFVSNLQSYLMFEVLESGWKDLVSKIQDAKTLDEVISAHDEYLDEIVNKSLIESLEDQDDKRNTEDIGGQLRLVLSIAYRFCKAHEKIFSKALSSVDKASEKRRGAEKRSKAGKWGFNDADPDVDGQYFYNLSNDGTLNQILSISQRFDLALRKLISMLNDKVNGTLAKAAVSSPPLSPIPLIQSEEPETCNDSLRFLTFRLDFSEFYNL